MQEGSEREQLGWTCWAVLFQPGWMGSRFMRSELQVRSSVRRRWALQTAFTSQPEGRGFGVWDTLGEWIVPTNKQFSTLYILYLKTNTRFDLKSKRACFVSLNSLLSHLAPLQMIRLLCYSGAHLHQLLLQLCLTFTKQGGNYLKRQVVTSNNLLFQF